MKKITLLLFSIIIMSMLPGDFLDSQLKYQRVRVAKSQKGAKVSQMLRAKGIETDNFNLFIRAFKNEKVLEVWAKNVSSSTYTLVNSYDFCATTGELGPKRRSGDKQIPEGFYKVDRFNPESAYYLSFRINYPNESDLVFADKLNPGDNIFIHGDCVTIGCIPIGDENIKELYLLAAMAKSAGDINVHIFPGKMNDMKFASSASAELKKFWDTLKPGFDAFERTKALPKITVGNDGFYKIN